MLGWPDRTLFWSLYQYALDESSVPYSTELEVFLGHVAL